MKKGDIFEEKFVISSSICNGFVELFNDRNPLHTDEAFAMEKGFQGRVMQGNILNGFLSFFVGECLPIKNVIIYAQQIKYFNPFYLNDVLKLRAEVADIFDSVNMVEFKYNFENQRLQNIAGGILQIGVLK
jgi:3-hydroxybutyryl-CoA dehydratase